MNRASNAPRGLFPKPYADLVARLRVPVGFLLVAAFAWFSSPTLRSVAVGVALSLPGLLLRAWAAGHLRKNATLTTSGPYGWIRNPLYAGTLIVAGGMAYAAQQWPLAILFGAVFLLIYLPAISLEEQHLADLFPDFASYARRVPLLLPYRGRFPGTQSFALVQYFHNREYEASLGFLAGVAFLVAKAYYFPGR
ncbi:MAG: isoprenylcysteine carboxylmethyltransferase family protein [Bryobacterales bacterium]|nr:isoprenylcysteine carboxylmethyltransferase family protein [Bryobacterales bacterium]